MATYGCVAVGTVDSWRGVFNGTDSYPTGLGRKVWAEGLRIGWDQLCEELVKYGTWKSYQSKGICPYCGNEASHVTLTKGPLIGWNLPRHIRDMALRIPVPPEQHAEDKEAESNAKDTGYPDPERKWHEHAPESAEEIQLKGFGDAIEHVDWLYLIDRGHGCMHVWRRSNDGLALMARPRLDGGTPDWDRIEEQDSPIQ